MHTQIFVFDLQLPANYEIRKSDGISIAGSIAVRLNIGTKTYVALNHMYSSVDCSLPGLKGNLVTQGNR